MVARVHNFVSSDSLSKPNGTNAGGGGKIDEFGGSIGVRRCDGTKYICTIYNFRYPPPTKKKRKEKKIRMRRLVQNFERVKQLCCSNRRQSVNVTQPDFADIKK